MDDMQQACQWRVTELTFQAARQYARPLPEVEMTAEFSGPGEAVVRLPAFWDGERDWKVRFTPPAPGTWRYRTRCNHADDAGLHGREGTLTVLPAAGDNPLYRHGGFLAVSDNARYLTYTDGTPFFWLGDTWWFCPSDLVPFATSNRPECPSMYRSLIDTRKQQGYSVVQMAFLGKLTPAGENSGVSGEYGQLFNAELDPAYWRQVDDYIRYANDAGIIPVIGFGFHQGLNAPTLEQLQTLWQYVLARYGACAVTWLICGEYNLAGGKDSHFTETDAARVEKMLALGQFIKDHDPYRRAMTIHPWWYGGEKRQAWEQPWYDFIMLQGGHGAQGPSPEVYANICTPAKPFLEGECTYEGIYGFSDTVVRQNAYKALQCGALGFTYGAHGLWYPTQDEKDDKFANWGEPIPWWLAVQAPGGAQMRHLCACYESVAWWKLAPVPANTVLAGAHLNSDAGYTMLASASGEETFLVYLPSHTPDPANPLTLTFVGGAKGAVYTGSLFNPRTGAVTPLAGDFPGQGRTPVPALPSAEDWMLIFRRR